MGLKRQKAELSLTYYYTNPDQSKNEDHGPQNKIKKKNIKKTNKTKKERNLLFNRQKAIFSNYYDPCCSPSNTVSYRSKLVLFMSYFSCYCPAFKKTEENSNPGHFARAVTDKLQMRRRGKVHGSF